MIDKRYRLGVGVTCIYVMAIAIYAYIQREAVLAMTPNEVGDALAGAASPLAFLWLVLGYLQQGEELRQNTDALRMQAEELRASVDQQRQLVQAANATVISAERPILTVTAEIDGELKRIEKGYNLLIKFKVTNTGRTHADRVFVHNTMVTLSGQDFLKNAWETLDRFSQTESVGVRPGSQVPPGESRTIAWGCFLSDEEVAKGRAYSGKTTGFLPSVVVAALVSYESIMGSKHATSVAYWVRWYDTLRQDYVDLPDGGDRSLEELMLVEVEFDRGPMR